jgi:hypothetical protein
VVHNVPEPGPGRFDLEAWFTANVDSGDTVNLWPGAVYQSERFSVEGLDDIALNGNGATLYTTLPPEPSEDPDRDWWRTFELVNCNGWTVRDLNVRGNRPDGATFDRSRAGQHGFSIRGGDNTILCRCSASDTWGDAFYIGDYTVPTTNLILCAPKARHIGRNAVTTVSAVDVLIFSPDFSDIGRTVFNFEVHVGQAVERWECYGATIGHYGTQLITATGEGDAVDVTFDKLTCSPTKYFNPLIFGTGSLALVGGKREYGKRERWAIRHASGAKDPKGRDYYAKFLYVEGLEITDVPYPMITIGSAMVEPSKESPNP